MGCNNSGQQAVAFTVSHLICVIIAFAAPWLTFVDEIVVSGTPQAYMTANYWLGGNFTATFDGNKNLQNSQYSVYDWKFLYDTSDPFFKPLGQASAISITCLAFQLILGLAALGAAESSRFSIWGRCCTSRPDSDGTTRCGRTVGKMPCGQNPIRAAIRSYRLHVLLLLISMVSAISYPSLMRDMIKETRATQTIGPISTDSYRVLSAGYAFQIIAFIMLLSATVTSSRWISRGREEMDKKKNKSNNGASSDWPASPYKVVEMNPVNTINTYPVPMPGAALI